MNKKTNKIDKENFKILSLKDREKSKNKEVYDFIDKSMLDYYFNFKDTLKGKNIKCISDKLFVEDLLFTSVLLDMRKDLADKEVFKLFDIILKEFNEFFDAYFILNFKYGYHGNSKLKETIEYAMMGGGKRFRAFLMFMVSYLYMPIYINYFYINLLMLSMEFVHAFSLVHDDLPAIDNDEMRRFKPSCWKKFGEATALLTGDAMLNEAYSILFFAMNYAFNIKADMLMGILDDYKIDSNRQVLNEIEEIRRFNSACFYLSDAVGMDGMINGELEDTLSDGKKLDIKTIKSIYKNKTGKLIEMSMVIPSIILDVDVTVSDIIYSISQKLGFAYQLKDDLLEYTSTPEKIGKSNKSDAKNKKWTYVSAVGIEKAEKELNSIKKYIMKKCDELEKIEYLDKKRVKVFRYFMLYILNREK